MAITAAQVKELREKTGAGMMDCKKALTETDGDIDGAIKFLREKGLAAAAKKAGRIAAEGLVGMHVGENVASIVEVNCETDFVAKNDDFQKLVGELAEQASKTAAKSVDDFLNEKFGDGTVKDAVTSAVATIGENISVRRLERKDDGNLYGTYSHGGTIGAVVSLKVKDGEKIDASAQALAKDLAMHVASESPLGIRESDIPAATIENERDIYKTQALESGKPENIVEKIVDGRVKKFLAESLLLEQQFIKDDIKVGKLVKKIAGELGTDIEVVSFTRFKVGEGIEKKADDLAAEVAKMTAG
jgi:elongation factor Ts